MIETWKLRIVITVAASWVFSIVPQSLGYTDLGVFLFHVAFFVTVYTLLLLLEILVLNVTRHLELIAEAGSINARIGLLGLERDDLDDREFRDALAYQLAVLNGCVNDQGEITSDQFFEQADEVITALKAIREKEKA